MTKMIYNSIHSSDDQIGSSEVVEYLGMIKEYNNNMDNMYVMEQ